MRKPENKKSDLEIAKEKILDVCREFNVAIEWEDYENCWLRDKDTDETTGFKRM